MQRRFFRLANRIILAILSATLIAPGSLAQIDLFHLPVGTFERALSANTLWKNERHILPLSGLDTLSVGFVANPAFASLACYARTCKYGRVTFLEKIGQPVKGINTYVILLGNTLLSGQRAALEDLLGKARCIIVLPGEKWLDAFSFLQEADGIVLADLHDPLSMDILAQQLFGALPLGADPGAAHTEGLPGGERLAYGPAGRTGMRLDIFEPVLDSIAHAAIDSGAFPGVQILVAKSGQIIFHKAYGYHTYAEKQPVRTEDIYDLASITKISSALPALMRWTGEGIFDLEATLGDYLPEFQSTDKGDLVWRDILAHQAGLQSWIPYWKSTTRKNGRFRAGTLKHRYSRRFPIKLTDSLYLHRNYQRKIYKAIKKSPLNPDQGYVYSGLSFYLQPEIVERLSGADFEQYLKRTFYSKLGAYTITYNPLRFFPPERIVPTERDTFFRKFQIHGKVHDEGAAMMDGVSANAGLFSTTEDLAKLMQMYLWKGRYGGEQFIRPDVLEEYTRCQFCDQGNRRGLGFDKPMVVYDPEKSAVARDASPSSFGHSGYTGTFVWADPVSELLFVFMSNRVFPSRYRRKIYTLGVRPAMHKALYDALEQKH